MTTGIDVHARRRDWRDARRRRNLQQQTEQLLKGLLRRIRSCVARAATPAHIIGGRQRLTTTLSNVSEVTGDTEAVNLSTVQLRDGSVLFMIGVAPPTNPGPT